MLALSQCRRSLDKLKDGRPIMQNYYTIFAWEIILRDLGTFILNDWICPKLAKDLHLYYNTLIQASAETVDNIIESLNLPTKAIWAPIANDYVKYNEVDYQGEVIRARM